MTPPPPPPDSVRGLLALLIEQVGELSRLYLAAARQEVEEGLAHLRVGGLLLGVAIGFFTLGGMVLVLFTVSAVSAVTGLPLWVTALIVLLGVVVLGGLFAWLGYRRLQRARVIPEQTLAAAKEDLEWAQQWTKRS